jgi:hypothetical protein
MGPKLIAAAETDARFMPARFELYSDAGEVWARLIADRDARLNNTIKAVRARRVFQQTFTHRRPLKAT